MRAGLWMVAAIGCACVEPVEGVDRTEPEAVDGVLTTWEDAGPTPGRLLGSAANQQVTFEITNPPSHGTLVLGDEGAYTYEPEADYHGQDAADFSVSLGDLSAAGTLTITVAPVNDAPAASDASGTGLEDEPVQGTLSGTDVDGDALSYRIVAGPAQGSATVEAATGAWTYTPDANRHGEDRFIAAVADGTVETYLNVDLTLTAVNDAPVATDDTLALPEDGGPVTASLQAEDVDADALIFTLDTEASHGTLVLLDAAQGTFRYTPAPNYAGDDSFAFTVSDGTLTDSATVAITIDAVNDLPLVDPLFLELDEDSSLHTTLVGHDIEQESLTYEIVAQPGYGTVDLQASGELTYTGQADTWGADTFTVRAVDGSGAGPTAQVFVYVRPVPDAPTADALSFDVDEDSQLDGSVTGADADGDAISFTVDTEPTHGTVDLQPSGDFSYTPEADFHGDDTFTVVASDGVLQSAPATLAITVAAMNDGPVAEDDDLETVQDVSANFDPRDNDSDVDGDALTVTSLDTPPASGTVDIEADGTLTYTPNPGYIGDDTFTYVVADPDGAQATATVSVRVLPAVCFYLAERKAYEGAVYRGRDLNNDGDLLDTDELVEVYRDVGDVLESFGPYAAAADDKGSVYTPDVSGRTVVAFHDRDYSGDFDDSERVVFFEDTTWTNGLQDVAVGPDGAVYAANLGTGAYHVLRMEDKNSDGDAMDADETTVWANTGSFKLDVDANGVMWASYYSTYRVEDLNGDGDALDNGEVVSYASAIGAPMQLGVAADASTGLVYSQHRQSGQDPDQVWVYEDLNNDGDAMDTDERKLLGTYDTANSVAVATDGEGGLFVTSTDSANSVWRVTGVDQDGELMLTKFVEGVDSNANMHRGPCPPHPPEPKTWLACGIASSHNSLPGGTTSDIIAFRFTFDPSAPDVQPAPNDSQYEQFYSDGAIANITVGDTVYEPTDPKFDIMTLDADSEDVYEVGFGNNAEFQFISSDDSFLDGEAMPADPPDISKTLTTNFGRVWSGTDYAQGPMYYFGEGDTCPPL